jgi:hypothetical protein
MQMTGPAGKPDPTALTEFEQRVVDALHYARATERAPATLRARIEAQRPSRAAAARRRTLYGGSLVGALAALALALVLVLPGGAPGAPSLSQAAAVAWRGPAGPAPAPDPSNPRVNLGRKIDDLYFPNWATNFGWKAVGQREDVIHGRHAVTVYYATWHGTRIAYTIVGAPALAAPSARVTWLNGTQLRTLTLDGRLVVTWRRADHTCILSAVGVPVHELQNLAAVEGSGPA